MKRREYTKEEIDAALGRLIEIDEFWRVWYDETELVGDYVYLTKYRGVPATPEYIIKTGFSYVWIWINLVAQPPLVEVMRKLNQVVAYGGNNPAVIDGIDDIKWSIASDEYDAETDLYGHNVLAIREGEDIALIELFRVFAVVSLDGLCLPGQKQNLYHIQKC